MCLSSTHKFYGDRIQKASWIFIMRDKTNKKMHIQKRKFIVLKTAQSPICFGHLLWPSSGRCSLKDILHIHLLHIIYKYKLLNFRIKVLKSTLKYEILIKLFVLNCVFMCCVFGDTIQAGVVVLCLLIALCVFSVAENVARSIWITFTVTHWL
jgi:hypothetical protein